MARRRLWWATWPGAIGIGLLGLFLAAPGLLTGLAWLLLPGADSSGLDEEIVAPSPWLGVLAGLQVVASLLLPALSLRWAKKAWLGYLLLGLALCSALGVVGLVQMGVL